jgi:hypothetical protein
MPFTSRRNPFQVLIISAFGLYCIAGLAAYDRVATATIRSFPIPWGMVFLGLSAVACSVALTGTIRGGTVHGILLERAGLTGLAGVSGAYALWGLGNGGWRSLAFCLLLVAIAAAAVWRVVQINAARRQAAP